MELSSTVGDPTSHWELRRGLQQYEEEIKVPKIGRLQGSTFTHILSQPGR